MPHAQNGESMMTRLKNREEEVEDSLPILMFKTDDVLMQIKRYIAVYLEPLLTDIEAA